MSGLHYGIPDRGAERRRQEQRYRPSQAVIAELEAAGWPTTVTVPPSAYGQIAGRDAWLEELGRLSPEAAERLLQKMRAAQPKARPQQTRHVERTAPAPSARSTTTISPQEARMGTTTQPLDLEEILFRDALRTLYNTEAPPVDLAERRPFAQPTAWQMETWKRLFILVQDAGLRLPRYVHVRFVQGEGGSFSKHGDRSTVALGVERDPAGFIRTCLHELRHAHDCNDPSTSGWSREDLEVEAHRFVNQAFQRFAAALL